MLQAWQQVKVKEGVQGLGNHAGRAGFVLVAADQATVRLDADEGRPSVDIAVTESDVEILSK